MSRIGRKPINIPAGVDVKVDGSVITVKGGKGELSYSFNPAMTVEVKDNAIEVSRPDDSKMNRSLHGLTRTLIHNMVVGVTDGYVKVLKVNGHQVIVEDTADIKLEVPDPNTIKVIGIDKQKVGQFAAEIREKRPPEPYKGKGIRYVDEYVRRKEGKAGKGK